MTKEAGTNTWGRPFWTMLQGLCLTLPVGGCLLTGEPPEPGLDIPQGYNYGPRNPKVAEAAVPPLDWWRAFRSRELTEIIEAAREGNLDIAAAIARIVQADANARITGADTSARLSISMVVRSRIRTSRASIGGWHRPARFGSSARDRSAFDSAVLTASYEEIDFWGKNRSALRAQEQLAVASRFDREVVGLTTVVSAANAYFQVLAAQDRLASVARQNLESATRVLNLIQQRLRGWHPDLRARHRAAGKPGEQSARRHSAARTDATAKQGHARAADGAIPGECKRSRRQPARHRLSRASRPDCHRVAWTQRPDIREAEANLAAANANVENARAQLLPSITGSPAKAAYQNAILRTLLRPESMLLHPQRPASPSLFSRAENCFGNLDLQKGKQDELLQNYRKAVISGFADVENALDDIRKTAEREKLQRDVVTSSQRAFDISEQRLREGTVDLVTVLQTQQTLYVAQDALVQARLAHVQAIVSLYQALGGGWLPKPVEASNAR